MKKIKEAFFIILPLLFARYAYLLRKVDGPFWQKQFADPDYAYLLNSLNLAEFKGPGHTDHPGTTVQIVGAVALRISQIFTNLFTHVEHIRVLVITDPENYLRFLLSVTVALFTLTLFATALILYRTTDRFWASMLFQCTPFLFMPTFSQYVDRFSPESFLMMSGLWLGCLVLFQTYSVSRLAPRRFGVLSGFIVSFGTVSKITFAPMILIPLALINGKRERLIYFSSVAASFCFLTLPIGKRYPYFLRWLIDVSAHSTVHRGVESWIDLTQIFQQVSVYFSTVFVVIVMAVGYALFSPATKENRLLFSLSLALTAEFAMVLRHFEGHYLIAALPFTGTALFLISQKAAGQTRVWVKVAAAALLVYLISPPLKEDLMFFNYLGKFSADFALEVHKIDEMIRTGYPQCAVITYEPNSPEYALQLGNSNAGNRHVNPLVDAYPNRYYYDLANGRYNYWNASFSLEFLREKYHCLIYQGRPFKGEIAAFLPRLPLKTLYEGKYETLYLYSSEK